MWAVIKRLVALAAIATIGLTLAGCYRDFGPVVAEPEPLPPPTVNTRLQLGDRLTVTIFNEPTLSGVYDITPGGFIDMPLIGQIKAVGVLIRNSRQKLPIVMLAGTSCKNRK